MQTFIFSMVWMILPHLLREVSLRSLSLAFFHDLRRFAEVKGIDFWELWEEEKERVLRQRFMNRKETESVEPNSSSEIFPGVSGDDMILYWTDGGDVHFSEQLQLWFHDLRRQYEQILVCWESIANPLQYIMETAWEGSQLCCEVYPFSWFFEESLSHMQEKKYLAYWVLYDRLIRDSKDQVQAEGDSQFVCYRYMALMANRELRTKVFGF